MQGDWSEQEIETIVADYFRMLEKDLRGQEYNKAEHNRQLQRIIPSRTRGSIERKHQNISAVLIELGYPYIDGYKPLSNYQQRLYSIIEEKLNNDGSLSQAAEIAIDKPVVGSASVNDLKLVDPPRRIETVSEIRDQQCLPRKPIRRNYLEIESKKPLLGLAGEKLVLEFEHKRLWEADRKDLANRIEHVSQSQGDGLGFDILSFETNGKERLIEVKTTRFGELTPFFASRNEVEVSDTRASEYQLYRLFKFSAAPKLFILPGSLRHTCSLTPMQFAALPK